ncbi:MAG: copper resistance protein CopC [Anaerolineae bacterium]
MWFTGAARTRLQPDHTARSDRKHGQHAAERRRPRRPEADVVAPGDLPDGVYTVSWRAISAADGHSTRGSYAFSVGAVSLALAQAAPDTETILLPSAPVRWLNLLSMALAVGSVSFAVCAWCAPPQERRMPPDGDRLGDGRHR